VVFGEVGLAGEVRATSQASLRIREAAQLGFRRCIVPQANATPEEPPGGMSVVGVRSVSDALDALL
jgi:DNA repair protein RadA/Sms